MSVSFINRLDDLVILDGDTESNILTADYKYGDAAELGLSCIAADAGTITIQVSNDDGANWFIYQEGAPLASVSPPAAGFSATYIGVLAYRSIKLVGSVASTDDSTFQVSTHITVGAGLA